MKYKLAIKLLGLVFVVFNANAFASETLRNNPFEQPDMTDGAWGVPGRTTTATDMELRGTLMDGQDSMANIDGEYYQLNHNISGYRVIRIESGSVTLSRDGNEMVLTLHNEE